MNTKELEKQLLALPGPQYRGQMLRAAAIVRKYALTGVVDSTLEGLDVGFQSMPSDAFLALRTRVSQARRAQHSSGEQRRARYLRLKERRAKVAGLAGEDA